MDLETLRVIIDATIAPMKKEMDKAKAVVKQSAEAMQKDANSVKINNSMSKDAEKQMTKARGMMSKLRQTSKQPMLDAGILVQTDEYTEISAKIKDARVELDKLQEKQNNLNPAKMYQVSEEYQELQECIAKSKKELDPLIAKQKEWDALGFDSSSGVYKKLVNQIEEARNTLQAFEQEEREMRADGSDKVYSAEWQNIQKQIDAATVKLEQYQRLQARMQIAGTDTKYKTAGLSNGSYLQMGGVMIKQQVASAKSSVGMAMTEIRAKIMQAVQSVPLIGRAATEAAYVGSAAFGKMRSILSSVGPAIRKTSGVFGTLIHKLKNGIGTVTSFGKKLTSIGRSASGAKQGFGGLLSTLKFTLIQMTFMAALNGMKEGFQNLALYSSTANKDISSLMNGLTQLKNSLAAAFTPILSVVAPILETFISYLVEAINAVGQFFAALTGQSTYTKAYKGTEDYAASLNDAASGADKATDASEKYKKSLMGFDQINKLDDSESSDSGSKGSGGNQFYTESVSSGMSNITQMLKDAWASADFTEVGALLGEKLNSALEMIPWDKIQETARKIAKSIATFLNGFIEATDWNLVGDTLAQGINTAIEFAHAFVTTFEWTGLGEAISSGINGAVSEIDFGKAGKTLSEGAKGLLNTISTALENTDWKALGKKVGEFLVNIDWIGALIKVGEVIVNALIGLLDFADGFFGVICDGFSDIDWKKVAEDAWDFFEKAWELVETTLSVAVSLLKKGWTTLSGFIGEFVSVYVGLIKSGWTSLKSFVGTSVSVTTKLLKSGWTTIKNFVGTSVSVSTKLIKSGWSTLKKWLGIENAFDLKFKLPKISVNWGTKTFAGFTIKYPIGFNTYAKGGFPKTGEMFIANEAGPEMVGRIGTRSAVANNNQIVAGIENGVKNAMSDVMADVIMAMRSQGSDGQIVNEVVIQIDSETVYRIVKKGKKKSDRRYYTVVPVG